jgi:ElaB/YqjD/DUF883 family membrane-anchored ribosome-binding protein
MDEAAPAQGPEHMQADLEKSRETSARLLDNLARRIRANRALSGAAGGIERAARYVRGDALGKAAAELDRMVRRRPLYSIAIAAAAGFVAGRALRSR